LMGGLMLIVSWLGTWFLRKESLPVWLAKSLVAMTFAGWIATLSGWYVTEIGRQPWLVHGILKTHDAVASNVEGGMILSTLLMYLALYVVLIISFISVLFYLARRATQPNLNPV